MLLEGKSNKASDNFHRMACSRIMGVQESQLKLFPGP